LCASTTALRDSLSAWISAIVPAIASQRAGVYAASRSGASSDSSASGVGVGARVVSMRLPSEFV
jgi:hypothetical protein